MTHYYISHEQPLFIRRTNPPWYRLSFEGISAGKASCAQLAAIYAQTLTRIGPSRIRITELDRASVGVAHHRRISVNLKEGLEETISGS